METLPTTNVTAKALPAVDTNIRGPFGSAVQGPIPDVPEPAFGSEVAAAHDRCLVLLIKAIA